MAFTLHTSMTKKRKKQTSKAERHQAAGDRLLSPDRATAPPAEDAEARSRRAFFGRSGHLAVMAEFLHRRINVAIPEVDVGDDVFVVKGNDEAVVRVQVKSATAEEQQNSYAGTFAVPEAQLLVPNDTPPLVYVFALRHDNRWSDFIVIRRSALLALRTKGAGSRSVGDDEKAIIRFRIVFTPTTTLCGPDEVADFRPYRNAWDPWPPPETKRDTAAIQRGDQLPAGNQASGRAAKR